MGRRLFEAILCKLPSAAGWREAFRRAELIGSVLD